MAGQASIAERISALQALGINERVLGLLELGIEGCSAKNAEQVYAALVGLSDEIIDDPELDGAVQRVYQDCLGMVGEGYFEVVASTLNVLLLIHQAQAVPLVRVPEAGSS